MGQPLFAVYANRKKRTILWTTPYLSSLGWFLCLYSQFPQLLVQVFFLRFSRGMMTIDDILLRSRQGTPWDTTVYVQDSMNGPLPFSL